MMIGQHIAVRRHEHTGADALLSVLHVGNAHHGGAQAFHHVRQCFFPLHRLRLLHKMRRVFRCCRRFCARKKDCRTAKCGQQPQFFPSFSHNASLLGSEFLCHREIGSAAWSGKVMRSSTSLPTFAPMVSNMCATVEYASSGTLFSSLKWPR